jgi:hypothetical protein
MTTVVDLATGAIEVKEAVRQPIEACDAQVLVLPARGPIDTTAAAFITSMVRLATPCSTTMIENSSGLMALASARQKLSDDVDTIVLVTVGGIDHRHLHFIVRRAERDFPNVRLIVLDCGFAGHKSEPMQREFGQSASSCARLVDVVAMLEVRPSGAARKAPPTPVASPAGPVCIVPSAAQ